MDTVLKKIHKIYEKLNIMKNPLANDILSLETELTCWNNLINTHQRNDHEMILNMILELQNELKVIHEDMDNKVMDLKEEVDNKLLDLNKREISHFQWTSHYIQPLIK
jgi:DNA anti-recombination protein RmuC